MLGHALRQACLTSLLRYRPPRLHTHAVCAAAVFEQRPSRGVKKREAHRMFELAQQLVATSRRQLVHLHTANMLDEELFDAVSLAQGIPRTNQVNLIAKLIRVMEDEDQQRVRDIVTQLQTRGDVNADQAAFDLAENWLAGLVAGDQAVADEINAMPPHWHDLQATRQLARRCQQLSAAFAAEAAAADADESPAKPAALVRSEKQLRKDLRLLASRYLQEQTAESATD